MRRVLIDTGPIVAILSGSDANHELCVAELRNLRGPLPTCWPVITEAAWLLRGSQDSVRKLFAAIQGGVLEILSLDGEDAGSIGSIMAKYADLRIQLADAALLHLAQREGIDTIFTLDRRDFSVLRLARGRKLKVLP